jgi:hypothetical protein
MTVEGEKFWVLSCVRWERSPTVRSPFYEKSMTLRAPTEVRQMIFAIAAFVAMAGSAFAQAQTPAPAPAAQHQIKLKNEPSTRVGTILSADGRMVQFQLAAGAVGIPLTNIEQISMPPPPEYDLMQQAISQRNTDKALEMAQAVSTKYKGLPTPWAKVAFGTAVNLLIAKDIAKAKTMNTEMNRLYPGAGGLQAKVSQALISIEEKDLLSAKDTLLPITEEALKAKNIPYDSALSYSQAFYALGRVQEADGKLQDALENYLRTVTIFYNDPSSRAAAQERADALRARNTGKKTSEQLTVP